MNQQFKMNLSNSKTAGIGRRIGAFVYDFICLLAILLVFSAIAVMINKGEANQGNGFSFLVFLTTYLFFIWSWTRGGQTIGMRAWKILLIDENNSYPSWKSANIRFFIGILTFLSLGLSYLWVFFDKKKLNPHDKFSASRVIILDKTSQIRHPASK